MVQLYDMPSPLFLHGKTLLASSMLVILGGAVLWHLQKTTDSPLQIVDITVEHQQGFGLNLSVGTEGTTHFIELGNTAASTIQVSLPMSWQRREVRNVPLSAVASDSPGLGYVRWTLPAGAYVSFRTKQGWSALRVQNPSKIPFKIRFTSVDLPRGMSESTVILLQDVPVILP